MFANQTPHPQSLAHAGGIGSVEAAKRSPEVQIALERQERALNSAAEVLDQLEMRLVPVIRADPPQTAADLANKAVRTTPSTQMACRIEEHADRVMVLASQMRSLLDRLEV
jgi:predicted dinucleotide-binding enzyme